MLFRVVFDVAQRPFDWSPVFVAGVFVAMGVLGFVVARHTKGSLLGPTLLIVVGLLTASFWVGVHYQHYQRLSEARRSGNYQIIIGRVEEFQPGGSNSPEVFTVNGRRFEVWPSMLEEGFSERVVDGGPDLSGRLVRIEYTDRGEILGSESAALPLAQARCSTPVFGGVSRTHQQ